MLRTILNEIFHFLTSKTLDYRWPFQGRSSPIHYVMQAANRQPGLRLRASVSWMCSLALIFENFKFSTKNYDFLKRPIPKKYLHFSLQFK